MKKNRKDRFSDNGGNVFQKGLETISDDRSRQEKKISVSRILNGSLCVELRPILLGDRILVPMLYIAF